MAGAQEAALRSWQAQARKFEAWNPKNFGLRFYELWLAILRTLVWDPQNFGFGILRTLALDPKNFGLGSSELWLWDPQNFGFGS